MREIACELLEVTTPLRWVQIDRPESTATAASGQWQVTTDRGQLLMDRHVTLVEVSRERLRTAWITEDTTMHINIVKKYLTFIDWAEYVLGIKFW